MEGKVWGISCLLGSSPSSRCPPGPGANPSSYPLQLSGFLLLGPAALPQPKRRPLPRPPPPPAPGGREGGAGGSRGLYLACGGRAVGAGARRWSWSPSWAGGDGPGRRGRREAAPFLTTQLPAPDPGRPACAQYRRPQLRELQSGEASVSSSPSLILPPPQYL